MLTAEDDVNNADDGVVDVVSSTGDRYLRGLICNVIIIRTEVYYNKSTLIRQQFHFNTTIIAV